MEIAIHTGVAPRDLARVVDSPSLGVTRAGIVNGQKNSSVEHEAVADVGRRTQVVSADISVGIDANSQRRDRAWNIDRAKHAAAQQESMFPLALVAGRVVRADDITTPVNADCTGERGAWKVDSGKDAII